MQVRDECTGRLSKEIASLDEHACNELAATDPTALADRVLAEIRWAVANPRRPTTQLDQLIDEHACLCAYHRARYTDRGWSFDRGELIRAHPVEYEQALDRALRRAARTADRYFHRDDAVAYVEDRLDRLHTEVTGNAWAYLARVLATKLLNFLERANPSLHESPEAFGPGDDEEGPTDARGRLARGVRVTESGSPVEDEVEARELEKRYRSLLVRLVTDQLAAGGLSWPDRIDDGWLAELAAAVQPGSRTGFNKSLARALLGLVVYVNAEDADTEQRGAVLLGFPSPEAERDARRRGLGALLGRLNRSLDGKRHRRLSIETWDKEMGQ